MPPEIAAALTALLVAACGFLAAELRARTARREREALEERIADVQAKVGADRRAHDGHRGGRARGDRADPGSESDG